MSDITPTPPRAPVFRCAECCAVWRTETQRDLCCTATPTPPPRLWEELIASREQQQRFEAQRRLVRAAAEAAEAERIREHGR